MSDQEIVVDNVADASEAESNIAPTQPQAFNYHFCAFRANRNTGEKTSMDGILTLSGRITTVKDYEAVKGIIAGNYDVPVNGLVVTSLTPL